MIDANLNSQIILISLSNFMELILLNSQINTFLPLFTFRPCLGHQIYGSNTSLLRGSLHKYIRLSYDSCSAYSLRIKCTNVGSFRMRPCQIVDIHLSLQFKIRGDGW